MSLSLSRALLCWLTLSEGYWWLSRAQLILNLVSQCGGVALHCRVTNGSLGDTAAER